MRRLEEQSMYERNNDTIMMTFWFILAIVQWNCLGETLDILDSNDQDSNRFTFGVVGEILINLVFCVDFFFFKKENYQRLHLHSAVYLGVDFLAGPVALIGDIITLLLSRQLNIYSTVFRSMKCLSSIYARRVFSKVSQIIPKVQDMFLCLFCVFYLFTYIATYMYAELFQKQYYFNTIGFSFFTMLQIMTLDGWGEIGRDILRRQNMLSASFLIVFVFIMAYFFWNILIGFILEILRSFERVDNPIQENQSVLQTNDSQSQNSTKIEAQQLGEEISGEDFDKKELRTNPVVTIDIQQSQKTLYASSSNKVELLELQNITNDNQNQDITIKNDLDDSDQEKINLQNSTESDNFFEDFCFGKLYKKVVIGLYFLIILNSLTNKDLSKIDGTLSEILHITTSLIYTIHTLFIYTQSSLRFQIERKHTWMMLFHLLSGPVALFFDIASLSNQGTIGLGGICKLFKAFTATREMIMGAIMIFPTLLPAFLGIISIIFLLAVWSLSYLKYVQNFWVDFNTSVYTFVQILTLDDWAAKICKDLLKENKYLTPFVIVGFIFVANYFFLNMMVAFSCETFKKVSNEDYVYRKERKQTDFYEKEESSTHDKNGPYHSLRELYADLEVIKDSHLNKHKFSGIQDLGIQKELNEKEQHAYKILLEAKNNQLNLTQPITFTLNNKTVTLTQSDLAQLKFNLCSPQIEDDQMDEFKSI